MADAKGRFTAWLSFSERDKVRDEAARLGTSENYIVRMAVREYFGMPTHEKSRETSVKSEHV